MSYKSKEADTSPYLRVENTTSKTEVKGAPALLHRILLSNHNAAAQTLIVYDDTTVITEIHVPGSAAFGSTLDLGFEIKIATSLHVEPSAVDIDAVVTYD